MKKLLLLLLIIPFLSFGQRCKIPKFQNSQYLTPTYQQVVNKKIPIRLTFKNLGGINDIEYQIGLDNIKRVNISSNNSINNKGDWFQFTIEFDYADWLQNRAIWVQAKCDNKKKSKQEVFSFHHNNFYNYYSKNTFERLMYTLSSSVEIFDNSINADHLINATTWHYKVNEVSVYNEGDVPFDYTVICNIYTEKNNISTAIELCKILGIENIVNFSPEIIVTTKQETNYNYELIDILNQFNGGDDAELKQYITSKDTKETIYKYQFVKKINTQNKPNNNTNNTAIDQLIKLSELLEKGLITKEEFDTQKKNILKP